MPERIINLQHLTLYEIRTFGLIHVYKGQSVFHQVLCFCPCFLVLECAGTRAGGGIGSRSGNICTGWLVLSTTLRKAINSSFFSRVEIFG